MDENLPSQRQQDQSAEQGSDEALEELMNPLSFDEQVDQLEDTDTYRGPKRKFTDPHYLWQRCKDYFDQCYQEGVVYTVPELAYHLGFISRQAIFHYEKRKDNCGKVIRAAKLKIEGQRNRQVVEGQGYMAGRIFDLKCNFGYSDQPGGADKTGDQPNPQLNVQQNFYGMPPQPASLEEWTKNYQKMMKSPDTQEKIEPPSEEEDDDSEETIDVSPSVQEGISEDD